MTDDELIAHIAELCRRRDNIPAGPSLTVAELYARYEAASKGRKSWASIRVHLAGCVTAFGARDAAGLKVIDWTEYRARRELELVPRGNGRTYSPTTINTQLSYLKVLLNWGVTQGLLLANPLQKAKRSAQRAHRETAPAEVDISALLEQADVRATAVVLCATDAGLRRLEIRSLQWAWIDREAMLIRLPGWACKGGRGGAVPMTRRLREALDAIPRALRSPWVFTSPRGGARYSLRAFSRWFRAVADAAGIQAAPEDGNVHLHDCRHAFASNATRRGVRIEIVSQVLRHASLDQTRDYVQTSDVDLRAAREAFEAGIERDKRR